MTRVDPDEVLLLWRALVSFRAGKRPACRPGGHSTGGLCPLVTRCPRWSEEDDERQALTETTDQTDRRRAAWPCTRLLEVLGPDVGRILP
jgi:hypothetical protein